MKRDYLGVKRDEANSGIDKLLDENSKLQSQIDRLEQENNLLKLDIKKARLEIKTNPELKKLDAQVAQLTKERDDAKAKLAHQLSGDRKTCSVGNHKLIVVSLSRNYSHEQQKAIQESLFKVLSNVKDLELPFTLFTIQSGRQPRRLLTSNELRGLDFTGGDYSILGKIENGIRFGARDLRALEDLGKLNAFIQNKADKGEKIGSVLYLTDNIRLDTSVTEKWNVSLAWCKKRMSLTVLTTKTCPVWKKIGAKCTSWQNQDELISQFNAFLNVGN